MRKNSFKTLKTFVGVLVTVPSKRAIHSKEIAAHATASGFRVDAHIRHGLKVDDTLITRHFYGFKQADEEGDTALCQIEIKERTDFKGRKDLVVDIFPLEGKLTADRPIWKINWGATKDESPAFFYEIPGTNKHLKVFSNTATK